MTMKTITEAAAEIGETLRTLRFWEIKGLVAPVRDGRSKARFYDPAAMERLKDIRRFTRYGFTLMEIRKGISRRDLVKRYADLQLEVIDRQAAVGELAKELDDMEDGSYG